MDTNSERFALCILVVDDNRDAAETFGALLRQLGHTVHTASRGRRALELLEALHADLVFLDLGLPDLDGFEVAKRIRSEPRLSQTRIIALTGHGDSMHRRRALHIGFDDYLVKPTALEEIREVLDRTRGLLEGSGQSAHPTC